MLIRHLKVSGLLSFGPKGLDLPLEPLNVLIGPNGSGKSNLLEILALLRAAPVKPVQEAIVEALVEYPDGNQPLRHSLSIAEHGERFEVMDERIENESPYGGKSDPYFYYRFQRGHPALNEFDKAKRALRRESVNPEQSILSQVRDPERYPAVAWLQQQYEGIRLYRWPRGSLTSGSKRARAVRFSE